MKLGEYIKIERQKSGLSQESLARSSDISIMTLWKIENGKTLEPGLNTISKIAKVLGVTVDSLIKTKRGE